MCFVHFAFSPWVFVSSYFPRISILLSGGQTCISIAFTFFHYFTNFPPVLLRDTEATATEYQQNAGTTPVPKFEHKQLNANIAILEKNRKKNTKVIVKLSIIGFFLIVQLDEPAFNRSHLIFYIMQKIFLFFHYYMSTYWVREGHCFWKR